MKNFNTCVSQNNYEYMNTDSVVSMEDLSPRFIQTGQNNWVSAKQINNARDISVPT